MSISLIWFRRGLRLHDNPALLSAVENSKSFAAVYIFDPPNGKLLNLLIEFKLLAIPIDVYSRHNLIYKY